MAIGVGQSRILGRVHRADMILEECGQTIQCSFTVLEDNKVDLLFGLDNLKRHQCCIDLVDSKLHFNRGEFAVSFLAEGQIKRNAFEAEKDLMLEKQRSMGGSGAASQVAEDGGAGAGGGGANEATVKELVDMGFTAEQV